MQKDLGRVPISPFQEKIAIENFFPGAGRGELLSQMQKAMQTGSAVLALTGEEGCGKTMMCRMLAYDTPDNSKAVLFSQTVESYEDVIHILALELGVERPSGERQSVGDTLVQITELLHAESLHLLIIFDEAENIYLATLERIRKMFDRIIAAGCSAHMVFAGRNNFIENCDQLTICEFQHDEELRFALLPFSEDATFEYLRECSERLSDQGHMASFTDDVIRKIFDISKGNVRMINILAEESLKNQGDDTSFMVLLDSVYEDIDLEEQVGEERRIGRLFRNYTSYLPWIGGLIICGLVFLFLLWPDEEEKQVESRDLNDAQVAFIEKAPEVIYTDNEESKGELAGTGKSWKIPEPQSVENITPAVETPEFPEVPAEVIQEEHEEAVQVVPEQELPVEPVERQEAEITAVEVEQPQVEKTIVQLRQIPPLKRSITEQPVPAKTKINVQPRNGAADMLIANGADTVDQVYQKRVLASTVWETHSKDQMYTVQLMVLTSRDAEDNVKKMLAKDEYRGLANNFYIFQKDIGAEVIFVFYGEYDTLAAARDAKNSMPEVLRQHKPYAISIVDAVKKAQK